MGSLLGFRPPHFSEEEAWLPAWLQPSTINNQAVEGHTLEEIGCLQQSINTRENGNMSEAGTCKSLHLFLSGEETNFLSCSTNHEVEYHLRLSSDEESQYSLNPTLSRSQAEQPDFNQACLVQQPEAKVISEEEEEAIELAVAASEALTIHKVLKDELSIASSDVLEAAIRVKEARLENSRENLSTSVEESNEFDFDFPSDLDYLTMADAYEDVGLSHDGYGSISHVNDSFASETYKSNAKHNCNVPGGLQVDSGSTSPKQINNDRTPLKGSTLESFECVTRKEHADYESLGTENANLACDVDLVFNEQTDYCTTEVGLQREGVSIGDLTPSQTILRSNEREDRMTSVVSDRFQSRWFGGWTGKNEVSIPAVANNKYKTSVPELFAIETSFLSESAPDMGSCMQRQDKDKTVSQSSVCAYEKANHNNNYGNLVTDDVAVSVSPTDPLCSVVPCSFTSDCVPSQNSEHQMNLEKHLGPTDQPNVDTVQVNGDSSPTVRRQVVSLSTYSMLHPSCGPYLDKEHTRGDSSSFEHNHTAKVDTELTSHRETVESIVPRRKRVRFSDTEIRFPQAKKFKKVPKTRLKDPSVAKRICRSRDKNSKTLFQDLKFLLSGFSIKKHKQIKILIQKNGGVVCDDIPSPSTSKRKRRSNLPPLILCPKKLLTTKFLYGCAVNAAGILKVTWLFDSIDAGLILPHGKYKVLSENNRNMIGNHPVRLIFDDVAIMLHGKPDFCSKMAKVIKHGGGSVFKTFHWLVKSRDSKRVSVGVIVVEDENATSRHLKQCALEQKVPIMPFNWIINSLYAGRLLHSPQLELPDHLIHVEMSEEI